MRIPLLALVIAAGCLFGAGAASGSIVGSQVIAKPDAVQWSVTYCSSAFASPIATVNVQRRGRLYSHRWSFPHFHHVGCTVLSLRWADYRWAPGTWRSRVRVDIDGETSVTPWQAFTLARRFP